MTPKASIRTALVIALVLTGSGASEAQTNWPAGRTRPAVSKSAKVRTPSHVRRRKLRASPETELLRSLADLVTRQAAAIELLSKRLEMAEAQLAALSRPESEPPMLTALEDPQAPFRASLSIEWAELLNR